MIIIYHPSIERYKIYPPKIKFLPACRGTETDCDSSGVIRLSRKIDKHIRLYNAANSAVAGNDIKINNVYAEKILDVDFLSLSKIDTDIDQGGNGCCQTMPYFTKIQSSLNFPVDFGSLMSCLSPSPSDKSPAGWKEMVRNAQNDKDNAENGVGNFYGKLSNLLFSGECIPIVEAPKDLKKCYPGEGYPLGNDGLRDGGKCACPSAKTGIKITVKTLPQPKNGKDITEQFKKYGPRPIDLQSRDMAKLWLVHNGHGNWKDLSNLYADQLYDLIKSKGGNADDIMYSGGHIVTLTNAYKTIDGKYRLELTNTWGGLSKTIEFDWESNLDLNMLNQGNDGGDSYAIEVTECNPGVGGDCDDDKNDTICQQLGYDYGNPDAIAGGDCPCECSAETNNRFISVQRVYDSYDKKCRCPKAGKLICGESYNSSTETTTENCDCVCKEGEPYALPCSGANGKSFILDDAIKSSYNIVSVSSINLA